MRLNSKNKKKTWEAEKRSLSAMATGICGRKIPVRDVEQEAVAYTSADGVIYLSEENPLYDGLSEAEKIAARKGVCVHEVLHQVKTNFKAMEQVSKSLPRFEIPVYATIDNIVEDCAIETQAEDVVGGIALECLDFIIAHTYKVSPKIDTAKSPFEQFMQAMIQYGDMGVPKGHFTFENAKKTFFRSTDIFKKAMEEPDGAKRCEYSRQIFEISRPLWIEDVKNNEKNAKALEDLLKTLDEFAKNNGMTNSEGKGTGKESSSDGSTRSSVAKKKKRQKITLEIISEEEKKRLQDEMEKNKESKSDGESGDSGSGSGDETGSGSASCANGLLTNEGDKNGSPLEGVAHIKATMEDLKKAIEKAKENGNSSSGSMNMPGAEDSDEKTEESDGTSEADGKKGEKDSKSGESDENGKDSTKGSNSDKDSDDSVNGDAESSSHDDQGDTKSRTSSTEDPTGGAASRHEGYEISNEEYELSVDDENSILAGIEEAIKDLEKEKMESAEVDVPDLDISSPYFKSASCQNITVRTNSTALGEEYGRLVSEMSGGIKALTNKFKRIFQNDAEEIVYKNSGKTDIKRMHNGKVTARVFDKRRYPSDKNDTAVFVLIDESGSMYTGNTRLTARNTAIALAEVFGKLNIPLYMMGFTADENGYQANHYHYIKWKNTAATRVRLLNIDARSDNFDGYSIRYATEILKKKNAKNKLLSIISDGAPACYSYGNEGIADTKDAIKSAKKVASVIGVGLGGVNVKAFQTMYGSDFLPINNINELFSGISQKMLKIVRGWD